MNTLPHAFINRFPSLKSLLMRYFQFILPRFGVLTHYVDIVGEQGGRKLVRSSKAWKDGDLPESLYDSGLELLNTDMLYDTVSYGFGSASRAFLCQEKVAC